MNVVIEYANLNKMNDDMIIKYINQFEANNNKIKYNKYFQQLKAQIPSLEQSIVDF
ncbi:MAG: hypothetical protein GY755_16450 [Chloroflexi bacterium]|nr:hypothetical protein [Chloroflexota bacterium]